MPNSATNIIAAILLIFMFILAVSSIIGDSLTMDELAHLPAGYSYLTQKDMRLNPEHPPLIKDLAAIPLLFVEGIKFPSEIKDWKNEINGQWGFGNYFLFKTGSPADEMIFWGRIPMILILILLGFYVFKWTKELFGNKAGLLALFLFSFSPTFLAHGRLVTTDVSAAAGALIATYYFIKALQNRSWKNIISSGIALGVAELLKFSLILLIPFFGILAIIWWLSKKQFKTALKVSFFTFLIAAILIWPVYQYHVWNYPQEKQKSDAEFILSSYGSRTIANSIIWMTEKPAFRPYAQYLLGIAMITQRAAGGNTGYFLGEVSAAGWKSYFPIVYLIKEPLTFHILTLIALLYLAWLIRKPFWKNIRAHILCARPSAKRFSALAFHRFKIWVNLHFSELAMLLFIAIYWITSLSSKLNIGVRHLLPTFPFAFALVAGATAIWLKPPLLKFKYLFLALLVIWQIFFVLSIYPHFLAYFNEIIGGPKNGYTYVVDSNLDWGQDLKRLAKWSEDNKIDKIYVDYFGGADTEYYLKEKYRRWDGTNSPQEFPKGNYLAVSTTLLQGGRGKPVAGFNQPHSYYLWLNEYEPVAIIGYSIFVYYID